MENKEHDSEGCDDAAKTDEDIISSIEDLLDEWKAVHAFQAVLDEIGEVLAERKVKKDE